MIDRKTGRSRGFGFVFLSETASTQDAINNMHGAIVDGRKISVTRAVPETQTMPGTPAPLLAAGKGIRSVRGVRGSAWDSERHSPRSVSRSRSTRCVQLHFVCPLKVGSVDATPHLSSPARFFMGTCLLQA